VQALYHLGLRYVVASRDTGEILAAFFYQQDADDYVADPNPMMVRGEVVDTGPAIHIEYLPD
jgi:hypothetical protein